MLGRQVESHASQQYGTGQTVLQIANKRTYQPGIYFVNIDMDGQHIIKKISIQ